MIKASKKIFDDNIEIIVSGHACYGPYGQDIVCSAVSSLFYTLYFSLDELTNDKVSVDFADDFSKIIIKNISDNGRLLVSSFFIGIREIASSYPNHVSIIE